MLINADSLAPLPLADGCVQTCVTSPPYWGLRDYGVPGQLGLEPTPDEYVANMVAVFREVRRVLRDDATLWLNLGDSYATGGDRQTGRNDTERETPGGRGGSFRGGTRRETDQRDGLKPKDLCGIPWRVAFALQADGWYLRSDIIWHKPNPMPESVTDRPTKAHEYIFLLSKSSRYYYDAEAVREPYSGPMYEGRDNGAILNGDRNDKGKTIGMTNPAGRNRRTVWTIATAPYSGAHFATFPPKLVEPCILAGTSERGCCPACGAPWERVVERSDIPTTSNKGSAFDKGKTGVNGNGRTQPGERFEKVVTGWRPTCACDMSGNAYEPDDFEIIETPTGERAGADPTMQTGRKGMNRPRGDNEGQRPITRYEQRRYADQIRNSPHRAAMATAAGQALDHYMRTDRAGARPVPPELLADWLARGWLELVTVPERRPYPPTPCLVLDPFNGSGTTGAVARKHGRRFVGLDLNPTYLRELALPRAEGKQTAASIAALPLFAQEQL